MRSYKTNCICNWAGKESMHWFSISIQTKHALLAIGRPCMESMPHWEQANHYTKWLACVTLKQDSVKLPSQALTYDWMDEGNLVLNEQRP